MAKNFYYVVDYGRDTKHRSDVLEVSTGQNLVYEIRRLEDIIKDTPTRMLAITPYETKKEAMRVADDNNQIARDGGYYLTAYEAVHTVEEWQEHEAAKAERQAEREAGNELPGLGQYKFSAYLSKCDDEYRVDIRIYDLKAESFGIAESLHSNFDRSEGSFSQALEGNYNEIRQALYNSPFPVGLPSEEEIAVYGDEGLYINNDTNRELPRVYTDGGKDLTLEFSYPADLSSDYYAGLSNDFYDDLRHDEPEPAAEKTVSKDKGHEDR